MGLALTLYNTVLVEPAERWEIDGERDLGRLATHPAYRGARRALAFVEARDGGRRPRALRVRQDNDIPLGRGGLGNSATAVVAAAAAAARLAGRSLDEADLITLAAEIEGHPDNAAAAVLGGLVVAVHAEGRVVARRLPLPRPPRVVLAIPSIEIPTSRARSRLPADLPFADAAFSVGRASLLVAALATGDHTLLAVAMEDRIHTPYRAPLVPGLHEALAAARDAGAWGAALSGSGPAVVALVEPDQPAREAAVASALAAAFARSGLQCAVRGVDVAAEGMTEVP